MEIVIKEIPEEGMDLHADVASDAWFRQVLQEAFTDFYQPGDLGAVDIHFLRTGLNVDFTGDVASDFHPVCIRCLKNFTSHIDVPLHLMLAPLYESERQLKLQQKDEVQLVKDDLEFSFYEGDRFNLADVIREQIILAIPLQPLCQAYCKGLCQRCGKDLNEGPCECKEDHSDPRWKPLKDIKLTPKV